MKFFELIREIDPQVTADHIESYYKDQKAEWYVKVIDDLLGMTPTDAEDMRIVLTHVIPDPNDPWYSEDDEEYYDVGGKNGKTYREDPNMGHFEPDDPRGDEEVGWALEFNPFSKWLDMELDPQCFSYGLSKEEIAGHMLWEMTFCGFTSEEVEAQGESLKATADEIKDNLDRGVPFEEFCDKLDDWIEEDERSE